MFKRAIRSKLNSSYDNLPFELLLDILLRLPAITLFICRFVSKTWRNVIDEPNFILKQFQLLENRSAPRYILTLERLQNCIVFVNRCADTLRLNRELVLAPTNYCIKALGCVNGVVLLKFNNIYILLNPLVNKMVKLSPCPCSCNPSHVIQDIDYALGFDTSINDFKVVAIQHYDDHTLLSIQVYNLSTSSWRTVEINNAAEVQNFCLVNQQVIFAQGLVYWKGVIWTKHVYKNRVLSFDFEHEVFKLITMPSLTSISFLFLYGDSLAIFDFNTRLIVQIWVMKKGANTGIESWTMLNSVRLDAELCWEIKPILKRSFATMRVAYLKTHHGLLFATERGEYVYYIDIGIMEYVRTPCDTRIDFMDHCVGSLFMCDAEDDESLRSILPTAKK